MALTPSGVPASPAPTHYVDWPAIFAGAVVATAIGVVFAGFGAALGLSAVSPQQGEGSAGFSLILIGLWALVTILCSYGAGGYVAGRMRRGAGDGTGDETKARDALHGMVVWGLGVLIGAWIAGSVVGTTARAVGSAASGVAQAAGSVVQGAGQALGGAAGAAADAAAEPGGVDLSGFNPVEAINRRLLAGTGEQIEPDAAERIGPVVQDVVVEVARTGELGDDDRQYLVDTIAANSTFTPEEINGRIDQAVERVTALRDEAAQRVEQAEQAARDAADAARRTAVLTGFLIAAGFAIALGAAMFGAGAGGRHRDQGTMFRFFRSY